MLNIASLILIAVAGQPSETEDIEFLNPSVQEAPNAPAIVTLISASLADPSRAEKYLRTLDQILAANPGFQTTSLEQEAALEQIVRIIAFSERFAVCRVVSVSADAVTCALPSGLTQTIKASTYRNQFSVGTTYLVGLSTTDRLSYLASNGFRAMHSTDHIFLDSKVKISLRGAI